MDRGLLVLGAGQGLILVSMPCSPQRIGVTQCDEWCIAPVLDVAPWFLSRQYAEDPSADGGLLARGVGQGLMLVLMP